MLMIIFGNLCADYLFETFVVRFLSIYEQRRQARNKQIAMKKDIEEAREQLGEWRQGSNGVDEKKGFITSFKEEQSNMVKSLHDDDDGELQNEGGENKSINKIVNHSNFNNIGTKKGNSTIGINPTIDE